MNKKIIYLIIFILIILCFIILFIKTNGYKIINLINIINKPYLEDKVFYETKNIKWCKKLRKNYKNIRDEYINYCKNHELVRLDEIIPNLTILDNTKEKWYIIVLKAFSVYTKNINYFPQTYNLISQIPGCTFAMFSILEPGKQIPRHNGVYNGVLRYHLALITDPDNYNKCFIVVDNKKYAWKEGDDVIFDDYYSHYVMNNTKTTRVVLFLDILKEFNNIFIDFMNKSLTKYIKFNDTTQKIIKKSNA